MTHVRFAIVLISLLFALGCGQTGELRLPESEKQVSAETSDAPTKDK